MKENRRRLKRITSSLSPTQAVCLWLEEAHGHGSLSAYTRWLLDQPEDVHPLVKMPRRVVEAVRTALKGEPREEVDREIHLVQRDVLFLFNLACALNAGAIELAETLGLKSLLLQEQLRALHVRRAMSDDMGLLRLLLSRELAYPLDRETAAAVEAAQRWGVETWESLQETEVLEDWVRAQYVREGKVELPWGAHIPFTDPETMPPPSLEVPTEDEIRALFPDENAFQAFADREDYSYGLADVADAEFETRLEALEAALEVLAAEGEVDAGRVLHLDAVPHEYLHDLPIVEGEWLDRYVLLLAEYGALLQRRGFEVRAANDDHPLAWSRIFRDGREVESEETDALLAEADRHLDKFPREVRMIDDRPYLRLTDYTKWRARWAKGRLDHYVSDGFVRESFNRLVELQQSTGSLALAGVRIESLTDYAADYPWQLVADDNEARVRRNVRRQLLDGLRTWTLSDPDQSSFFWARQGPLDQAPFREEVADWCQQAEAVLGELGQFASASRLVERRYFGGHALLFPEAAAVLESFQEAVGGQIDLVNDHFVHAWEQFAGFRPPADADAADAFRLERIDVGQILEQADGKARAAYFVDMAKAEALEKLGEREASIRLVEEWVQARDS